MKLILPEQIANNIQAEIAGSQFSQDFQLVRSDDLGNIDGDATDAEVFLNWFYLKKPTLHRILEVAPNLRWQHTPSAGVNHILTPEFLQRDIILTNGAGVHAIPIAEFVLAFILNHAKKLPKLQAFQANRYWKKEEFDLPELMDSTLLIVGAGGIGQAIAQRANAFGMRVWGSRRHPEPLPHFEKIVSATEWRSLLPGADYVVIATPLTSETKGMVDADAFRAMRSTAYLINIARGAIVDETALAIALQEGWIAGAGLDTVCTEPLPPDSPLWTLPNAFITPHCSGFSPKAVERSITLFLDNLQRYCNGQSLRNVVNQSIGY